VLAARAAAVRGGFYHCGAYNTGWWASHPGAWRPYGWNAAYGWRWATWPALTTWFGWGADPLYFDYGNNIYYSGDQVYLDDQPGPTAAEYYQQSYDLAQSAPVAPPSQPMEEQWQPLGVFSLVQNEQADTSAVFQLAVDKNGIIRGNYTNVLTNTTLPVRGAVDRRAQRASWIVGDQKDTVYDTGIYNLTKDESPLLVHYGKDRTQQWLLVRVQEKDGSPQQASPQVITFPTPPPAEGTARLTIVLPPDAELYFDGTPTTKIGSERTFVTPLLDGDKTYYYSLRARWTQDGRPVEQSRRVTVKAGSQVRVDFTSPQP
jgi:uncharacterized protein (TIGR03000 family)